MANKIKVKLIMELRAAGMSQRQISRTRHMSQHSVGDVCRIAAEKGISYEDIRDKEDDDIYQWFFPGKYYPNPYLKRPIILMSTKNLRELMLL